MNWIAPRPLPSQSPEGQTQMMLAHGYDTQLFAEALRWQADTDAMVERYRVANENEQARSGIVDALLKLKTSRPATGER